MAAIAAVHADAPRWEATDWQQIVDLYDALTEIWPSPVVALNRAIAIGQARGPHAGLAALDELATEPQLAGYHYLPAARADFLRRLHRTAEARLAYHEALLLGRQPRRTRLPHPPPCRPRRRALTVGTSAPSPAARPALGEPRIPGQREGRM